MQAAFTMPSVSRSTISPSSYNPLTKRTFLRRYVLKSASVGITACPNV
nr:MAG TPA_asm: hypothetical protein [Bacteriophage sp.]